jgi:hypothetical protein
MKQRHELLLHLRSKIDEQISAAQDIQVGKGRIQDKALRGKDNRFPDLRADPVAVFNFDKEPLEPLRRHISGNIGGIDTLAGLVNRILVQIGGKDVQGKFLRGLDTFHSLLEHDSQGICFLPGGAAWHPGPQGLAIRPFGQERWDDAVAQLFPRSAVAKETRHAEEQFLEQQIQFLRVFLQVTDIGGNLVNLVDAHAALDPPVKGVFLVKRKVMAGVGAQKNDGLFQGALRLACECQLGSMGQWSPLQISEDPATAKFDGMPRSAIDSGLADIVAPADELPGRILHQHDACLLFDGPQSQRAVGAHARENDAQAVFLLVLGQGAEEEINRQAQSQRRRGFEQVQNSVQDGHVFIGRDHIDPVRLDFGAIPDLDHLHAGGALEQLGHDPFAGGVQMLNDDKSQSAVLRHVREKTLQSLQTSGRSANANDGTRKLHGDAGRYRRSNRRRRWPSARR